jgi:hypothetical protein
VIVVAARRIEAHEQLLLDYGKSFWIGTGIVPKEL